MGTPTNRTPVRVARGSTTALNTGLSDIQEGEIVWDTTLNKLQVKEGSALENHITDSSTLAPLAGATFTGAVTFPSPNVSNGPLTFKTTSGGSGYVGMGLSYYQHVNYGGLSSNRCNVFDITSGGDTQFLIPDDATKLTITTSSWAGSSRPADTGRLAEFTGNGSVDLYYDGNKKLETTATGVSITGEVAATGKVDCDTVDIRNGQITSDGSGHLSFADDVVANWGTHSDGRIFYENSTNEFHIRTPGGTADIIIGGGANTKFTNEDGNTEYARINSSGGFVLKKSAVGEITALTDGTTIAVDFSAANNYSVTLAGNRTLGQPTNQVAGQSGSIFVTQDGTGSRTLAYHADWKWAGGTAPTLSTTAAAVDRIDYIVAAANKIHAVATLAVA